MNCFLRKIKNGWSFRLILAVILPTFVLSTVGNAQILPSSQLPVIPGSLQVIPPVLKGVIIDPNDPFHFEFIVADGDTPLEGDHLKKESEKLIKYFLTSLTTPEEDLWVNLSPYEPDRIVPKEFGQTQMGQDMLLEDYFLKQLTSSMIQPEGDTGKKFWDEIYQKAQKYYGTTDIPVFNPPAPPQSGEAGEASPNQEGWAGKVWIMPDQAVVYEHGSKAFVAEARLKVKLQEDIPPPEWGRLGGGEVKQSPSLNPSRKGRETQLIEKIILPAIEREVNEGQNFATLRQIYHSLILAAWFKKTLKESLLGQVYVDKKKMEGVKEEEGEKGIERVYENYIKAFKQGVYDQIKEDYDPVTQNVISRKYFLGGVDAAVQKSIKVGSTAQRVAQDLRGQKVDQVSVKIDPAMTARPKDAAMLVTRKEAKLIKAIEGAVMGYLELNDLKSIGFTQFSDVMPVLEMYGIRIGREDKEKHTIEVRNISYAEIMEVILIRSGQTILEKALVALFKNEGRAWDAIAELKRGRIYSNSQEVDGSFQFWSNFKNPAVNQKKQQWLEITQKYLADESSAGQVDAKVTPAPAMGLNFENVANEFAVQAEMILGDRLERLRNKKGSRAYNYKDMTGIRTLRVARKVKALASMSNHEKVKLIEDNEEIRAVLAEQLLELNNGRWNFVFRSAAPTPQAGTVLESQVLPRTASTAGGEVLRMRGPGQPTPDDFEHAFGEVEKRLKIRGESVESGVPREEILKMLNSMQPGESMEATQFYLAQTLERNPQITAKYEKINGNGGNYKRKLSVVDDQAMTATPAAVVQEQKPGGILFDPKTIHMKVERDQGMMSSPHFDQSSLKNFEGLQGFRVNILQIFPANVPLLLGLPS